MLNCLEFKYVYMMHINVSRTKKSRQTIQILTVKLTACVCIYVCVVRTIIISYYLEEAEEEETNDDIKSCFSTPQHVVDDAGSTDVIISQQSIPNPKGKE